MENKNAQLIERGFGRSLGFGSAPAILVIDMMNAFTDPNLPLGMNQDKEIGAINKLLNLAHKQSLPSYFTVVSYDDENLADAGLWYHKQKGLDTLRAGTTEVEIDSRIERYGPVIVKKYASAFFGTDLVSRLNSMHRDTLIIAGCTTSGCVRATAVDAIQLGLRPIVVEEAVADRLTQAHKQSLIDLQLKYADVKTLDETIDYLGSLGGLR